uniref:protein Niban 2-like n=1 Tax=Myxine glutinosa TaxID=7769 RepID=UPI00358E5AA8
MSKLRLSIGAAGYCVLSSFDDYTALLDAAFDAKAGGWQLPAGGVAVVLWHPYDRHHLFCTTNETDQKEWVAVFQECIRHRNNGLSEPESVESQTFSEAVRLYRQQNGNYGTWDMFCGNEAMILANLCIEAELPRLRADIRPKLKGKLPERLRNWTLVLSAVYTLLQQQADAAYKNLSTEVQGLKSEIEAAARSDLDQIVASRDHLFAKIRASMGQHVDTCCHENVQPLLGGALDALMVAVSEGFVEQQQLFQVETQTLARSLQKDGGAEHLHKYMHDLQVLPWNTLKMLPCYEQAERLPDQLSHLKISLGFCSPRSLVHRTQGLMQELMDDATYTFEQYLHQSLTREEVTDTPAQAVQKAQERVLKKYGYDSSTVRKRFFREALLQVMAPFLFSSLCPDSKKDLEKFNELIFEDYSKFIHVENLYEELILQTVSKDIFQVVKAAAVQSRHNLYRDSIVFLPESDFNLAALGEDPNIDWQAMLEAKGAEAAEMMNDASQQQPERRHVVHEGEGDSVKKIAVVEEKDEEQHTMDSEAIGAKHEPKEEDPKDFPKEEKEDMAAGGENQGLPQEMKEPTDEVMAASVDDSVISLPVAEEGNAPLVLEEDRPLKECDETDATNIQNAREDSSMVRKENESEEVSNGGREEFEEQKENKQTEKEVKHKQKEEETHVVEEADTKDEQIEELLDQQNDLPKDTEQHGCEKLNGVVVEEMDAEEETISLNKMNMEEERKQKENLEKKAMEESEQKGNLVEKKTNAEESREKEEGTELSDCLHEREPVFV